MKLLAFLIGALAAAATVSLLGLVKLRIEESRLAKITADAADRQLIREAQKAPRKVCK